MESIHRESAARDGVARGVTIKSGKLTENRGLVPEVSKNPRGIRTLSEFIVAEVTISFKSRRRDKTDERELRSDQCICRPQELTHSSVIDP